MIRTAWAFRCLLGVLLISAPSVRAVTCGDVSFAGASYTLCEVDARTERLALGDVGPRLVERRLPLFLRDKEGNILGQFSSVDRLLESDGLRLAFATNAGMYHEDRAPVGYYLQDGEQVMRVVPNAGPGNFGLLPNGILCLRRDRADVIETRAFLDSEPDCVHATQSGPMLVVDGELHPKFLAGGTSKYIRNGVGTSADGARVVFAISNEPVNFHSFGLLFRDYLELPNALYLDGNISRLYAPDIGRSDFGFALGPIVGVVEPIR